MQALLATTYFGPVQWYQKLCRYDSVLIERHESFRKQSFRNRCVIATANGPQALTVPVTRGESAMTRDTRVSDHGNWRHLHWHALMSAYSESPFFDYYADDLRPFFERRYDFLYDLNMDICTKMCELLDLRPDIRETTEFLKTGTSNAEPEAKNGEQATRNEEQGTTEDAKQEHPRDFRNVIDPKHPLPDTDFEPRRYYQVFERRHGFIPNLSILDLLFNMGPEAIFYLL